MTGALGDSGIILPKLHIQSSYGLLNYPDLACDYVRVGIALYGVLSSPILVDQYAAFWVGQISRKAVTIPDSGTGKNYGYYTEMPGHGINETLSAFVPIYTIYLYKAGGENAVNSSV